MNTISTPPKLDWTFDLEVNQATILGFVQAYTPAALDFMIIEDLDNNDQRYYSWSSPHLSELADENEIRYRAAALKVLYDGAMLIHTRGDHVIRPSHGPIEKHSRRSLVLEFPFAPFCNHWASWRYDSSQNPTAHLVSASLYLARYDEHIRGILSFLGANRASWISLCATLDFLQRAGWSNGKLAKAVNVEESEFTRLNQTANHPAIVGPFARHGDKGWAPPKKPMSLADARKLIFDSCKHVIHSRGAEIDAHFKNAVLQP